MNEFSTANEVGTEFNPRRKDAPLQEIYGVGPKKADQLEEAGYLTVYDLAAVTSPSVLAESVDFISDSEAREFVEQARSIVEYWPGDSE